MSIRRAYSSIIPLALRSCKSPKSCNPSIFPALNSLNRRVGSQPARFSTTSVDDDDIAQLIISDNRSCRKSPDVEAASHMANNGPIPFTVADEDLEEGTMTLIRKSKDEVISVDVSTCREEHYVDDYIEHYFDDGEDETDEEDETGEEDETDEEDEGDTNETDEEDEGDTNEVQSNGETSNKKVEFPCLYMKVKIYYGHKYSRRLKFFVIAYRDGQIGVRSAIMMSDISHMEELFNKYCKDRGIEPNATSFLLDYFPARKQLYLKTLRERRHAEGK